MSDNFTAQVGNLTRDPELRFTPSGQTTVSFSIAVNRRWQNQSTKEWEEATSFFNVEAWRELAEHASSSFKRGDRVIVSGRLDQNNWETPEGDKRSRVTIVADEIGASVKFATVQITKDESKRTNSNGNTAASAAAAVAGDDDEEPF